MHTRSLLTALLAIGLAASAHGQPQQKLVGTIESQLVPDWLDSSISVTEAQTAAAASLGDLRPSEARVWVGEIEFGDRKQPVYLIEAPPGVLAVLTDLNGDGKLTREESVRLDTATKDDVRVVLAATLRFATPGAAFSSYPLRVGLRALPAGSDAGRGEPAPRVSLRISSRAFVVGRVTIGGKPILLRVPASPKTFSVNAAKGYQYIDCNGDGEIDDAYTSVEMGHADGEPVVFHVVAGDRYLSIDGFDFARKTVTLLDHPASDYDRIELVAGRPVPDFSFVALDGSAHRLSEFRGKYLLLDFWGTWCGPCVGDVPALKKAYDVYKDRGFDILGMDTELPDVTAADFEKGLATVKAFVADRGITWTQARTESIKRLYQRRFMIVAYPTYVLLDPKGVIVAVNKGLKGEELEKTLAGLFKGK